jgi:hypothetical protein
MLRFAGLAEHRGEWGLCVDGRLVASTDDPMTADLAQHWTRRILGEHVTFQPGHASGGYRVANPDQRGGARMPGTGEDRS